MCNQYGEFRSTWRSCTSPEYMKVFLLSHIFSIKQILFKIVKKYPILYREIDFSYQGWISATTPIIVGNPFLPKSYDPLLIQIIFWYLFANLSFEYWEIVSFANKSCIEYRISNNIIVIWILHVDYCYQKKQNQCSSNIHYIQFLINKKQLGQEQKKGSNFTTYTERLSSKLLFLVSCVILVSISVVINLLTVH